MPDNYGFGILIKQNKEITGRSGHFQSLLDISREEYEQCIAAHNELDNYRKNAQLFKIVIWNFEDYWNIQNEYLSAYVQKDVKFLLDKPADLNLNRYMMNYLSSVRSYLDYIEASVKRKYGKPSSNTENFKRSCSEAFDNNFSYRFLYKFRNYAQHYGLPITHIYFIGKLNDAEPKGSIRTLEIGINKDELLNSGWDWGKLKPEIAEQPSIIEVNTHINVMMSCLKEIHTKYISSEFASLRNSATYLRSFIERIPKQANDLQLFKISTLPDDRVNVKMQPLHIDLIDRVFDEKFAILFKQE